jgi:hypothetical protein
MEISGFWQHQEVWSSDAYEQSLILARVQKTRHAYKSQWENQVEDSLYLSVNENYARAIMT